MCVPKGIYLLTLSIRESIKVQENSVLGEFKLETLNLKLISTRKRY